MTRGRTSWFAPEWTGWLYLAVVEDLFSRKIVGWAMDQTMESRLVVDIGNVAQLRTREE